MTSLTYDTKKLPKPEIKYVLLALCTCKRPVMLKNALFSTNNLIVQSNLKVEILVIDND